MSGVNKVILVGRLGRDPEIKDAKGIAIANFSIATSKTWKDESGEKQEKTEWHNIVAFKKTAELAGKFLTKGREIYVEGELQTRSWEDKETGVKKYRTEIIAQNIQFLGSKPEANGETTKEVYPEQPQTEQIPF
jgi:single-strand DNA-binding protein